MLLCFWGSGEPINVCSQRGEEHSESQLFPQAMGNKEVGDSAERERGEGVDNMFPFLVNTEGNNMITAVLTCSEYDADSTGRRRTDKINKNAFLNNIPIELLILFTFFKQINYVLREVTTKNSSIKHKLYITAKRKMCVRNDKQTVSGQHYPTMFKG